LIGSTPLKSPVDVTRWITLRPVVADRMDDIRAVMDAAGIERAALYGISEHERSVALALDAQREEERTA
jgi:hypothetical protein